MVLVSTPTCTSIDTEYFSVIRTAVPAKVNRPFMLPSESRPLSHQKCRVLSSSSGRVCGCSGSAVRRLPLPGPAAGCRHKQPVGAFLNRDAAAKHAFGKGAHDLGSFRPCARRRGSLSDSTYSWPRSMYLRSSYVEPAFFRIDHFFTGSLGQVYRGGCCTVVMFCRLTQGHHPVKCLLVEHVDAAAGMAG